MTVADISSASFTPSKNVAHLESTCLQEIWREVERRRAVGESVFDLSRDEWTFESPRGIVDAAAKAFQQGRVAPVEAQGLLDLRAAAARHFSLMSGGRPINADHVVVANGARQAVFGACLALFESGDCVLVPSPFWPPYQGLVRLARAIPIVIPGDLEWSLKVSVVDLERASDARTAGLILGTPVNPTGAVYTRSELKSILQWARSRGAWVIVDESHRRLHFGTGPAPSVLDLPDELLEHAVVVTGFDHAYALAGWRVGIALAPSAVARTMATLQEHVVGGASVPAQWAAAAALADDRVASELDRLMEELTERRAQVVAFFRDRLPGVEFVEPLGAQFLFFRVDGFFDGEITNAGELCERLLAEQGVALAPGQAFGDERWVRLGYGVPGRMLREALERFAGFTATLARRETQ